jgi:hypothetical protein
VIVPAKGPLVLVYADGSLPLAVRPKPQPFRLPQGVDVDIAFRVVRSDGSAVNILGWIIKFTMAEDPDDEPIIDRAHTVELASAGTGRFSIDQSDTITALIPTLGPPSGPYQATVTATLPGGALAELMPPTGVDLGPIIGEPDAVPVPPPPVDLTGFSGDDLLPALVVTAEAQFAQVLEIGQSLINPAFTADYNGVTLTSLTIDDGTGPLPVALASQAAFAYDGGASGLPVRSFVRSAINAQVQWIVAATRNTIFGPLTVDTVVAADWQARAFWGIGPVPGAFDEAFIEALGASRLQSGIDEDYDFSAPDTEYLWLATPSGWGGPSAIVEQHGDDVPMIVVATGVSVTSPFGAEEPYSLRRSINAYFVAYTLTVRF